MLTLILAAPRTGKSQLTVSKLWQHKQEGKRVFVTNFKQTPAQRAATGFELFGDDGGMLENGKFRDVWEGDVSRWFEDLPDGSVWCIDEAQEVFPQRGKDRTLPEFIKLFSKHGHKDLTIYVVTQDAMQLDVHLRRNSNITLYMTRPLNMRRALVYTFRGYQEIPNDAWRRSQVLKSAESKVKFKYRKKWQDMYVSASAHDHIKLRLPLRLLILPIATIIVLTLLWFAWSRLKAQSAGDGTVAKVAAAVIGAQAPTAATAGDESAPISSDEYLAKFKERVPDVPWSAPAYDGFEVTDYPRPYCYIGNKGCRCFSQQGSLMTISVRQCKAYVENGYFDPYRKERDPGAGQSPAVMPADSAGASSSVSTFTDRQINGYGAMGPRNTDSAPVGDFSMR